MMHLNPLVLVGAVIGVITALLVAAYAAVKDKKTAMGFERNMEDGEIMRRLARYARPYLSKFLIVGVLMLFSIAYDIISPLIVGRIEELVAGEFELRALFLGVSVYAGVLVFSMGSTYLQAVICSGWASASSPICARICSATLNLWHTSSSTRSRWASWSPE